MQIYNAQNSKKAIHELLFPFGTTPKILVISDDSTNKNLHYVLTLYLSPSSINIQYGVSKLFINRWGYPQLQKNFVTGQLQNTNKWLNNIESVSTQRMTNSMGNEINHTHTHTRTLTHSLTHSSKHGEFKVISTYIFFLRRYQFINFCFWLLWSFRFLFREFKKLEFLFFTSTRNFLHWITYFTSIYNIFILLNCQNYPFGSIKSIDKKWSLCWSTFCSKFFRMWSISKSLVL